MCCISLVHAHTAFPCLFYVSRSSCMSMLLFHVSCTCCMSVQNIHAAGHSCCQCGFFMLHVRATYTVHAACLCCISASRAYVFNADCPYCLSVLHVLVDAPCHVLPACPCKCSMSCPSCMSIMHVIEMETWKSMLDIQAAGPRCMCMLLCILFVHAAGPRCMSKLHVHDKLPWCISILPCRCCMSILHVSAAFRVVVYPA